MATINSFLEFMQVFPNEDSCIQYLEKKRWKDRIIMAQLQISVAYFCSIGLYFLV